MSMSIFFYLLISALRIPYFDNSLSQIVILLFKIYFYSIGLIHVIHYLAGLYSFIWDLVICKYRPSKYKKIIPQIILINLNYTIVYLIHFYYYFGHFY